MLTMPTFPYETLVSLNPAQQEAVEHHHGPLLVLAGAGTGKTRVLTERAVRLVTQHQVPISSILVVTFTNKAAQEMRERIGRSVGLEGAWIGTFHAIAARMLRRHASHVGLPESFTILDTDDQIRVIKELLLAHQVDEKRFQAKWIHGLIGRWKELGISPDTPLQQVAREDAAGQVAWSMYPHYQHKLRQLHAVDFGDLLLHICSIWRAYPAILQHYQQQFPYLLVDEYQDTNTIQYAWLTMLAKGHGNICCVGDDDQSIYGWRGADVKNILRFEEDFPSARIIRLEQNYRSTPDILAAASHVIAHNRTRLGKTLWTIRERTHPVTVVATWDETSETGYIAGTIASLTGADAASTEDGTTLPGCAILVRAGFQTRAFEECFVSRRLPYRIIGGLRFYERQEIRDALAYLRLVVDSCDDLAFERIINTPKRGVGTATLHRLRATATAAGQALLPTLEAMLSAQEIRGNTATTLASFVQQMAYWRSKWQEGESHPALAERILNESGYRALWQKERNVEAVARLENLKEFTRALQDFEDIPTFLEHVSLVMDHEADPRRAQHAVQIMTLHAAKGLEFDVVFLPGWEEGMFPNQRALEEQSLTGLEEERRLAYVGMTRAKKRLFITYAANRRVYHQWQSSVPSRFLDELPENHIQTIDMRHHYYRMPLATSEATLAGASTARMAAPSTAPCSSPAAAKPFKPQKPRSRASIAYAIGSKVQHPTFGHGIVQAVDGPALEIRFESCGEKSIMASFVQAVTVEA